MIVCSVAGVIIILLHFRSLESRLVESTSIKRAQDLATILAEFRILYSSEVVRTARDMNIPVTHNYKEIDKAIPLPATFSMLLGNSLTAKLDGGHTKLYSAYPFPWREKEGGLRDEFAKDAWQYFTKDPSRPFYKFEEKNGLKILRYATADVMKSSCINCHNTHPDSPKNDWKVGDIRGVLEVAIYIDSAEAMTEENFKETFALLFGITTFGVLVHYTGN